MMKKLYLLLLTAGLSVPTMAQKSFELGKPNDDNYRYLDGYKALKETSTIRSIPTSNSVRGLLLTRMSATAHIKV